MNGVIFDLDGTLADTLGDIADSLNHVLTALGQPTHSPDRVVDWIGWGVRHLVERAVADPDTVDEALGAFRARYAEHLVVRTAPYPGVPALLDGLVDDGVALAVLSNKPHAETVRIVESVFARWSFADARGHRPPAPRKPDPSAALDIATAMGIAPTDLAFVGDTPVDIETARAAGMIPIGVAWGFRPAEALRDAGAVMVADSPETLLAYTRTHRPK